MSLIRWEPIDELDRFFRDLQSITPHRGGAVGHDMAVDLHEDDTDLVAEMHVPGLKADDIDVEVEDGYLRIAGQREEVQDKKEKNHYQKEIRRGQFDRVVQLPDRVDADNVKATYNDGVLQVRMPKVANEAHKKIAVTTG